MRVDAGQWSELSVIFEGQLLDSTIGNSTIIFGDVEREVNLGVVADCPVASVRVVGLIYGFCCHCPTELTCPLLERRGEPPDYELRFS